MPRPSNKRRKREKLNASDLRGFKYYEELRPLLKSLHDVGTARDTAGNRQLFYDQYICLLLLYFFNPVITSMRGLQEAASLEKVQKLFGVKSASLGSLSESVQVFDPEPLRYIIQELAARAIHNEKGSTEEGLAALQSLTAVDGTLLRALPRMVWALGPGHVEHAAKMHLQFDCFKGIPLDATVTAGKQSETAELKGMLQPGRLYVFDRGYASHDLFLDILEAKSSFVARIKDNAAYNVTEAKTVTPGARAIGVQQDLILGKLGSSHRADKIKQPVRLVIAEVDKPEGGKMMLHLLTDRFDLDAELVTLAYRYRWTIELFFRWFKCTLRCRHLLSESNNGVTIQCYAALIASLLIVIWTGLKPSKRTWEMLQHYFMGLASLEELQKHLLKRQLAETQKTLAVAR